MDVTEQVNKLMAMIQVDDRISCDNCGEKTRAWDWSPTYDRFCLECLSGEPSDPREDRGDYEYHQGAGQ